MRKLVVVCSLLLFACGCATYRTPGGAVSIPAITDSTIAEALARQPAAQFPAHLIVARVQATGYASATGAGYGKGQFSVVTKRDIETEEDFAQLASLPGIAGVGPLNRIVLPVSLRSAQELREAAAQLRGDVVLLYTVDTSFHTESKMVAPLQLVTLGIFASEKSRIVTTCAAAFIDVRTGFVYGVAEGTATDVRRSSVWTTEDAIDSARLKTEREAFAAALKEAGKTWTAINAEHNRTTAALR
ncbi:MAG TPA: hypothetical protein VFO35_09585 [Steroidobacteraceae bacterium]|nr:hypothetical protein [Steroidobacteraceae bacterium]